MKKIFKIRNKNRKFRWKFRGTDFWKWK